jgi:5-formyltetrahydrofolate cyclo-ligase
MRARRRAVPAAARDGASAALVRHVAYAIPLRKGARVALYAAMREEIDTAPLFAWARARGLEIYLPRLVDHRRGLMRFVRETRSTAPNRFGIPEPVGSRAIAAHWLDAVFLPLVAFDGRGARLGMGAGYYDRALAFRRRRRLWRGPLLVGLAYSFQELPRIELRAHDVLLDAVVTERGVRRFRGRDSCTTG